MKVRIEHIDTSHRFRTIFDPDELTTLAQSILDHGLLQPIRIIHKDNLTDFDPAEYDEARPYMLILGERRIRAHKELGRKSINATVQKEPMSIWALRSQELEENIERADMRWDEELLLLLEIHELKLKEKGRKHKGNPEGHSDAKMAELVNKERSSVTKDLQLARQIRDMPVLRTQESKSAAWKQYHAIYEALLLKELFNRFELPDEEEETAPEGVTEVQAERFMKKVHYGYKVGDAFDLIQRVPDGSIDFMDIDPDYGIDLATTHPDSVGVAEYHETAAEDLIPQARKLAEECYRCLADDSWALWWFAEDQQSAELRQALAEWFEISCTFYWIKPGARNMNPQFTLTRNYEPAFVLRKGHPELARPGAAATYLCSPEPHTHRLHPAQKPMELYEYLITVFTRRKEMIYIPFLGSGNALLTSLVLDRRAYGSDLSEHYKHGCILHARSWELPERHNQWIHAENTSTGIGADESEDDAGGNGSGNGGIKV